MKKSLALFLMAATATFVLFLGGCKKAEEPMGETSTATEQPKVVEETGTAETTGTMTTSTETSETPSSMSTESTSTTSTESTSTTGSSTTK